MNKFWGLRVNEVISYKDIYLTASAFEILEGNLVFKNEYGSIIFCVANTDWICFYEARKTDGKPVCVDVWDPVNRNGDEY